MKKEKKFKPSKELPLGFVDRQEKELLTRDFIISNIKEVMIKYGFQYLETPSFEYTESMENIYQIKIGPTKVFFPFKTKRIGFHSVMILQHLWQDMLLKIIWKFQNLLKDIN